MRQFKILENFIVLEGVDGAGTSTQLQLLDKKLRDKDVPHVCTYEPTNNIVGRQIRKILNKEVSVRPETIALLFTADRNEHIHAPDEGIAAELARGKLVISDRYLFSSLAYQSIDCGWEWVYALNAGFPLPQHLFFIDTPVNVSQKRLSRRTHQELFDAESYQEKVYKAYQHVLEFYEPTALRLHVIDGRLSIGEIFGQIWSILGSLPIINAV